MDDLRASASLMASLLAFEAAARLGSFTRAAEDLGVSQPAISFRIRQLEQRLGGPLFTRQGRGVLLTEVGLRLQQDVKAGFERLHEAVIAIERRAASRNTVTVAVSSAFANYWLLPRIRRFQDRHPAIELRVLTTDRTLDLLAERIPFAVRYGDSAWPDHDAWLVAHEVILPVCAPSYLAQHGRIRSIGDIARHRLIELHEPHYKHLTWDDWFREMKLKRRRGSKQLDFTDYALVVKSALAGDGIALGWRHLVGDLLKEGSLVAPLPNSLTTGRSYWLVMPRAWPATPALTRFRDWLLAEARLSGDF